MTQITIDGTLASQLLQQATPAELFDPSGRFVGRFVPPVDLSNWEPVTDDVTDDELERRAQSDDWYTHEEVMEHLKQLGSQ